MSRRIALAIFGLALALRLVYIAQIRALVWFDVPIVDGANYFRVAKVIADGDLLAGSQAFWQPPLYPYVVAALLKILGSRMALIFATQAAIGALSCVLAAAIATRLGGRRAGVAAGMVMAFYGPLIHFDAQPLVPVVHIALALAGIVVLLRAADGPRGSLWAGAGLLWGLAATATPNILLAVPPAALWIRRAAAAAAPPGRAAPRPAWRPALLFLVGVGLPVALVAARNLLVAGEPVLISSNGGINFYLGNNPDYDRTVRLRPGGEFERLAQEPEDLGIVGAAAKSRWFTGRAADFLVNYPGPALRLYAGKIRDLLAGREIPRNEDMYGYRRASGLLWALLWRLGIAFPFGVVAPLAAAGVVTARDAPGGGRAAARLLLLFAGAYAVSILLFFPTDRYRLPIVPVLAVFAGVMLTAGAAAWRRGATIAVLAAGVVAFNLDAFTPAESFPEEEALNRAYALRVKGRLEEAKEEYRRAIALNPGRIDPHNALAVIAADAGQWDEAVTHYRDVLALAPDFVDVRRSLGEALRAQGRIEEARREWQTAAHLAPAAGLALADLALSYLEEGALETAFDFGDQAVRARPDLPETHFALAMAARALRRRDVVQRELTEAARLFPPGTPGRRRAEELLDRMRRREAS
jgi:tetratricopeptide (TPR) repeat protein